MAWRLIWRRPRGLRRPAQLGRRRTPKPEGYGLKLSDLFIEDLKDNEDLWLHLGATASLYTESPKGVRKLIAAVLMQMCGITFVTIIAAAEQNTTVLKAEVEYNYGRLPNLYVVEEIQKCLDEV